jgi:PBP1b-binding outer membrane lipoprotein LpoB
MESKEPQMNDNDQLPQMGAVARFADCESDQERQEYVEFLSNSTDAEQVGITEEDKTQAADWALGILKGEV